MSITFSEICHSFGDTPVLHDISFEVGDGEVVCLLGPSGSGKSTLLRVAAGLEPLQSGRIEVDGEVLALPGREPPPEERSVGLVFQEHVLFPHLSVSQNVAYGLDNLARDERQQRVTRWLTSVGLQDYGSRYPHTLSGGQQQRVALVRALAPEPRVMRLD